MSTSPAMQPRPRNMGRPFERTRGGRADGGRADGDRSGFAPPAGAAHGAVEQREPAPATDRNVGEVAEGRPAPQTTEAGRRPLGRGGGSYRGSGLYRYAEPPASSSSSRGNNRRMPSPPPRFRAAAAAAAAGGSGNGGGGGERSYHHHQQQQQHHHHQPQHHHHHQRREPANQQPGGANADPAFYDDDDDNDANDAYDDRSAAGTERPRTVRSQSLTLSAQQEASRKGRAASVAAAAAAAAAAASAAASTTTSGNECVVCCRDIVVYAVGQCDHTVCDICSTRLRVLCKTRECPVCRATVDKVFFIRNNSSFAELNERKFTLQEKEFGIFFEDEEIRLRYDERLQHKCNECERRALIAKRSGERPPALEVHETFADLADHVLREHRRQFCRLCVEHLNLFTFERQAYSKNDLRRHLTEGDLDDKSHKGHPLCDFCKQNFLDKDELYRHLKVEHFSCFICSAASAVRRVLQYYHTYEDLRQHFQRDHFLCEQGECEATRFVAFKTELEYKAHCASTHADLLTRDEQRAARNVNIDFGILPPDRELISADGQSSSRRAGRDGESRRRMGGDFGDDRAAHNGYGKSSRGSGEPEDGNPDRRGSSRRGGRGGAFLRRGDRDDHRRRDDTSPSAEAAAPDTWDLPPAVDMNSTAEFPSLEGVSTVTNSLLIPTPQYGRKMTTAQTFEDFPSLGSTTDASGPPRGLACCSKVPNFKSILESQNRNHSVPNRGSFTSSAATRANTSIVMVPPPPSARPTVVASADSRAGAARGELFPSLPLPVADDTFGKVLKPLPQKKKGQQQKSTKHGTSNGAVGSSGWAAMASAGVTIKNAADTKKSKKSNGPEVNGNSAPSARLVGGPLRDSWGDLVSLPADLENYNSRVNNTQETKGGETLDDFDLGSCGASWATVGPRKKNSLREKQKLAKPPTQPRGLRRDEEFPSLGPAQAPTESPCNVGQVKPKYRGLKPGEMTKLSRPEGAYIYPPYHTKRSTELMGMLKLLLDGDTEQVCEYRTLLANFRAELITAEEFVEQCLKLFSDPVEFTKIFPEVIYLLPDIVKQNELASLYDGLKLRYKIPSSRGGSRGEKNNEPWVRCAECSQITAPEDSQAHQRAH